MIHYILNINKFSRSVLFFKIDSIRYTNLIHVGRYYSNGNYYYGGSSTYYCNSDNDCTGNLKCCYSYGKRQCTYPHYTGGLGITNSGIGIGL